MTKKDFVGNTGRRINSGTSRRTRRTRIKILAVCLLTASALGLAGMAWLSSKASTIRTELGTAMGLIPLVKEHIADNSPEKALAAVDELRTHTSAARAAAEDPLWTLASSLPGLGANFSAVAEVTRTGDDVANLGVVPLVNVFQSLKWDTLLPSSAGTDLEPLRKAAPSVASAAHAMRVSGQRLEGIDASVLLPQVAEPLKLAKEQLQEVTGALDAAANASQLAPQMLGDDGPRNYLLMIQNNAEARASGGIPGALAVLTLDDGRLSLGTQSSASAIGVMSPTLAVDDVQQQIYSGRLGKFMQDVNLTPDFPTAASTAQRMWERKAGQRVDGVISMDPVALSYILEATGPVQITSPEVIALANDRLPTELTSQNVVPTLLSDVYAKITRPQLQDAYFAGVAQEVFAALSSGNGDATALLKGITKGTAEGRILLWSGFKDEQTIIANYPLSGSITGPSVSPAQFGVYFNDGTGAKMDYYVKRTVQLVKECVKDGYEQTTVRVTSTNTAPSDAAISLPEYVTGGGIFGVPAGTVRTNVIAYGPVQANVETAVVDAKKTEFAAYHHGNRPVGVVAVTLAPGQSSITELTFGRIVQHTEPNLVVTPTVQPVKDVILKNEARECIASTKTAS